MIFAVDSSHRDFVPKPPRCHCDLFAPVEVGPLESLYGDPVEKRRIRIERTEVGRAAVNGNIEADVLRVDPVATEKNVGPPLVSAKDDALHPLEAFPRRALAHKRHDGVQCKRLTLEKKLFGALDVDGTEIDKPRRVHVSIPYFVPPTEMRCSNVRMYNRPPPTANEECVPSRIGFSASS